MLEFLSKMNFHKGINESYRIYSEFGLIYTLQYGRRRSVHKMMTVTV